MAVDVARVEALEHRGMLLLPGSRRDCALLQTPVLARKLVIGQLYIAATGLRLTGVNAARFRRSGRHRTSLTEAKALHRAARSFAFIDDARRDAWYAIRTLRRSPGFTAMAVLTLGLGSKISDSRLKILDFRFY